jgi:bifunctional N-acetylglucosamine-1-phosphate-uridyltransferase/glucosamine-1-phosphate-acetyltransferase GlmU-like protein
MGPFAHLRPGTYISRGVHLGNYVEVKTHDWVKIPRRVISAILATPR